MLSPFEMAFGSTGTILSSPSFGALPVPIELTSLRTLLLQCKSPIASYKSNQTRSLSDLVADFVELLSEAGKQKREK